MALVDSYPSSNSDSETVIRAGSTTLIAQTFVGDGSSLCATTFYLAKTNSPTGNVIAYLYATSSGVPTGSALATSLSIPASSISAWSTYTLTTFIFSPYTLTNGTTYAIVVGFSGGDASNYINVGIDISSPSHSGTCYSYSATWTEHSTYDLIFYVHKSIVTVRAIGTPVTGTGTTLTPTIPSGTQDGDLMVAFVPCRSTASPSDETGWTGTALTLSSVNFKLHYRFKQSGDGNPTFDFTNGGSETVCAFIISFYNVHTTTPLDVAITDAGDFSAPADPYDVTLTGFNTSTDGAFAVYGWVSLDDNTWVYQSGGGAGLVSQNATDATDISICVAGESIPTAGATGDQVARQTTKAADAGALFYFALKPVPASTAINIGTGGTFAQAGKVSESLAAAVSAQTALAPSVSQAAKLTESLATLVLPPDFVISTPAQAAAMAEDLAAAIEEQQEVEIESAAQAARVTESLTGAVVAQTTLEASCTDVGAVTEVLAGAVEAQVDLGASATQAGAVTEALAGAVGEAPAVEPLLVQVDQAVHLTEWFSPPFTETIGISDTVTAEVLEAILDVNISTPAQAAAVTEDLAASISTPLVLEASADQAAAVSEVLKSDIQLDASAIQSAALTEDIAAAVAAQVDLDAGVDQAAAVSDTLGVAIATPVTLESSIADNARMSEARTVTVEGIAATLEVIVADAVKTTESTAAQVIAQVALELAAVDSMAVVDTNLTAAIASQVDLNAEVAQAGAVSEDLAALIASTPAVTGRGRFRRIPGRGCIAGGFVCIPGDTPIDAPDMEKI